MEEIFNEKLFVEDMAEVIRECLENSKHKATGFAAKSVGVEEVGDGHYNITGASYQPYIESGSGPAPRSYTKMIESLEVWSKAKNLGFDRKVLGAITHSIIKNGTQTYQQGGEDVWSSAVQKFIDEHIGDDKYYSITL